MTHIYRLLALFLLLQADAFAQCSGGTNAGALSPAPNAGYQSMNVTTGNYYTFVVPSGCMPTYDFSFCSADGSNATFDSQITILDNTGAAVPGGYSDDFCGVQSRVTWTPTAAGTYRVLVNTYYCGTGNTALLVYRAVTPANMAYSSSTVTQASTATVQKCDLDQAILGISVVTTGTCNALALNQFQINMTGSTIPGTNTNDVTKIHIYYTGTSNAFAPSNEFLPGGTTPAAGTITINGNQALASGTNYFWIAYDINSTSATIANLLDAQCTSLRIGVTNYIPSVTNPAGTRAIAACSAYPGSSSANLKTWLRANTGVTTTGSSVTQWNDQSGAGITGNFIVQPGTPAQTSPTLVNNAINNNPYISFNGTTNSLSSTNSFTGNSIFGTNNNTLFMVHNVKAGVVYFKWETIGSGAYRVGYELNGTAARFDFVDDGSGQNALSTTNVQNKDVLVTTTTTAAASTMYFNSNTGGIRTFSGLNFSPGATTRPLCIGNNDLAFNNLPSTIDYAELMVYNTLLSASEIRRVESYLAIKYGITLKNNQGTGAAVTYMNSSGTSIWGATHAGYHNNVTGIGRDDASTLNQRMSRGILSLNPSVDAVTLVNGTFATPAAFSSNLSTLLAGHNNASLQSIYGDPTFSNYPSSLGTNGARIQRVWKAQATNFTQTVSVGFESTLLTGYLPVSNLRLLVDDDGNFANGGTTIYSGAVLNGTRIEFSGVTNLGNAGNLFFTLATINYTNTPLPVSMLDFSGHCSSNAVELNWATATETNNDHFTVMRTAGNAVFDTVAVIPGGHNTTQPRYYSWKDESPAPGMNYYRLCQTDENGTSTVSGFVTVASCATFAVAVYPNPGNGEFTIGMHLENKTEISYRVTDITGRIVRATKTITLDAGHQQQPLLLRDVNAGVYFLEVLIGNEAQVFRLVKNE
jgi:hypothetical protein